VDGAAEKAATRSPSWGPIVLAGAMPLGLALLAAPLAATSPPLVLLGLIIGAVAVAVVAHPPLAAYLLLATTPLLVGIDRDKVLPMVRPNEAVALLLGGALLARGLYGAIARRTVTVRPGRVELSLLLLAVTGSLLPLLSMLARGREVTQDDLLYGLTLWKYLAIYLLTRASVRTPGQVRICLRICLATAAAVAIIAILQALELFDVPNLLAAWYAPFDDAGALAINRGTSTLSNAQATADVLVFNLAIASAWLAAGATGRPALVGASLLFVVGIVATGTFSGLVGLLVALIAVGLLTGRFARILGAVVPLAAAAGLALRPVLASRLEKISPEKAVPSSWIGRVENLRTYFWPEFKQDFSNMVLGVRLSARIPAPEAWRRYIFIESGYTWLLWTGGIPFLAAFVWFAWTTMRVTAWVARNQNDAIGVAAIASFAALCVTTTLMLVDPHLTLRGSADLSFPLLALALTAFRGRGATRTVPLSVSSEKKGGPS
jgi:hypothetical protein